MASPRIPWRTAQCPQWRHREAAGCQWRELALRGLHRYIIRKFWILRANSDERARGRHNKRPEFLSVTWEQTKHQTDEHTLNMHGCSTSQWNKKWHTNMEQSKKDKVRLTTKMDACFSVTELWRGACCKAWENESTKKTVSQHKRNRLEIASLCDWFSCNSGTEFYKTCFDGWLVWQVSGVARQHPSSLRFISGPFRVCGGLGGWCVWEATPLLY